MHGTHCSSAEFSGVFSLSQEYTEDKHVTLHRLGAARRLLEAMLILVGLFAIWLMAALISFNPSDPSWSQTAWHEPIHNIAGLPGAWLADTLLFIFGVIAYPLPIILLGSCWFAWHYRDNDGHSTDYFAVALRLIGALALIVTSCGLAAMNADDIWYFASGGVIGSLLGTALAPWMNISESTIVLLVIWAAGLTLFTGWSWVTIVEKIGGALFYLLIFASHRARYDQYEQQQISEETPARSPVTIPEPAAPVPPSRPTGLLRGARFKRQKLIEKFASPASESDKALFSGSRLQLNEPVLNMVDLAASPETDDVLFSGHSITEQPVIQQRDAGENNPDTTTDTTDDNMACDGTRLTQDTAVVACIDNIDDIAADPLLSPTTDHPATPGISFSLAPESIDQQDEHEITIASAPAAPAHSPVNIGQVSAQTTPHAPATVQPAVPENTVSLIHPLLMRNGDNQPLVKPDTPLPVLDLLASPSMEIEPVDNFVLEQMARLVEARLEDFRIKAQVVNYLPGPVITRFELNLAAGVKASRISGLARDLARSLSAVAVRIVEVIPGKPYVGLELPNKKRQTVYLREVLDCPQFRDSRSPLSLVLGKDIAGQPVVADLAKMPHLLVAGTTGSGKSVGVNAMILSMLYKATPEDVRFIMIDPKMLELSVYEGIPHLLTEVVTDMKDAANALSWCVNEMERRYKLMSALGVRNLAGYNDKIRQAQEMERPIPDPFWKPGDSMATTHPVLEKLPFIVVLVDEFADLMMTVGKKVEELIARLAQKARAAGIHLVLATQRPSVDVITGLIKANIPTRIAFTVSSKIDSRTILDQGGAESLLGMGDMLYAPQGSNMPIRIHGAFVRDQEVHAVVQDWRARGRPQYIDGITAETESEKGSTDIENGEALDPLFDQVVNFVAEKRKASISAVQRQFRIGYNRSARIVEQMEIQGIVSEQGHNGNREVLIPPPSY